jgi:isoquinoline 1-oxidoreductase beta subunit
VKSDKSMVEQDLLAVFGPGYGEFAGSRGSAPGINRRQFLVLTGLSGLAIGFAGAGSSAWGQTAAAIDQPGLNLNQYVQIDTGGRITLFTPNPEVGQGVRTSLPMILAEELDADWGQVTVASAEIDQQRYGIQYAGGSNSVRQRYPELRKMGAMARLMLIGAAAGKLQVTPDQLTTGNSQVIHEASGRKLAYAELAEAAAGQPVPGEDAITYKNPSDYRILGRRVSNVDNPAIVTGSPLFGIDVSLPGMLFATYVKCPTIGGSVRAANLDAVKALPGVVDAFVIEGNNAIPSYDPSGDLVSPGVAIVADSTWQAFKAREKLEVDWDLSGASTDDSGVIRAQAIEQAARPDGELIVDKGNIDDVFAQSAKLVESFYATEFASHAQLEPNNCTVRVKGDSVECWAPTQTPTGTVIGLAKVLGVAPERVTVHQIRGGGGFGRRLENDYAREAALIAKKVGVPVKLQWKREDDMAFDYFRPPGYNALKASLTKDGKVDGWHHHVISVSADGNSPNHAAGYRTSFFPEHVMENVRVTNSLVLSKTPTGPMRAPVSNTYAFAEQSFIHELAVAARRDHVEFLIETLGEPRWVTEGDPKAINTGRAVATIQQVARNAGWGRQMPANRALGLSFFFSHASHVAEIAEVGVDDKNRVTVHTVWVVADIGPVINLSGAEGQCQGSVIDALSTMADQKVTIKEGVVQQTNYDDYPLLTIRQQPQINVMFLATDYDPTGMGEPAFPPLAAAVCNAIFTLTGKRIRNLPISNEGFRI